MKKTEKSEIIIKKILKILSKEMIT